MTVYDDLNELVMGARDEVHLNDRRVSQLEASLNHFIRWALDNAGVE